MPGQQYRIHCRLPGGADAPTVEAPLEMPTAGLAARLDQKIELPDLPALRVTQYLPQAKLEQEVIPSTDTQHARPAILLAIEGPKQSFDRWLVAGDDERNRLTSFIGTWRYMAVADPAQRDELFALFKNELTRQPTLRITRTTDQKTASAPATLGSTTELGDLDCRVRVERFVPDFAFEKDTGKVVAQSDKRVNPAALVVLEHNGQRETRWVFAKFPDFKMTEQESLPFQVALDCPTESEHPTPDFAVVTTARKSHEAWTRHEGKTTAQPLDADTRVEVAGTNYKFFIKKFIPAGQLRERYVEVSRRGVPAIKIESTDAAGAPLEVWIPLGKRRSLSTSQGPIAVSFLPAAQPSMPSGHGVPHP
jgi:hypothetical protein